MKQCANCNGFVQSEQGLGSCIKHHMQGKEVTAQYSCPEFLQKTGINVLLPGNDFTIKLLSFYQMAFNGTCSFHNRAGAFDKLLHTPAVNSWIASYIFETIMPYRHMVDTYQYWAPAADEVVAAIIDVDENIQRLLSLTEYSFDVRKKNSKELFYKLTQLYRAMGRCVEGFPQIAHSHYMGRLRGVMAVLAEHSGIDFFSIFELKQDD